MAIKNIKLIIQTQQRFHQKLDAAVDIKPIGHSNDDSWLHG